MRSPTACGSVKSNGVPFTLRISPVGIEFSSMGTKKSALIWHTTFIAEGVGLAIPAREKKPWLVMFTTVFLLVVPL